MPKQKKKKKSFVLRISPEMYTELEIWASQEFRSINGQLEYIINNALKARKKKEKKDAEPE